MSRSDDRAAMVRARNLPEWKCPADPIYIADDIAAERAACAALCREAGCLCHAFAAMEGSEELTLFVFLGALDYRTQPPTVTCHDPRCPDALASRIEARGAE